MAHDPDIATLSEEVASLQAVVQEQAAELAAVRQAAESDTPVSRRHLLRNLAGLGAAGVAGMVATAEPAAAADGDALILGQDNTASGSTRLTTSAGSTGQGALELSGDGFFVLSVSGTQTNDSANYAIGAGAKNIAILAQSQEAIAVAGESQAGGSPAVTGTHNGGGPGIGGMSVGGGPQLWLSVDPTDPPGPPAAGTRARGQIRFDVNGDLWACIADGTPGTWTRLLREDTAPGRVVPITPFRALDTRRPGGQASGGPAIPGQVQGPLSSGQTVTLDLAGVAPIPPSASGVIGNATVSRPTAPGRLQVFPSGAVNTTSTVNFTNATVANTFTSGLGPSGLSAVATLLAPGSYQLVLDITAYIT